MALVTNTIPRVALAVGVVLGLAPVFGGAEVLLLTLALLCALVPYGLFAALERSWPRPFAVGVLLVLAVSHAVLTVIVVGSLDEDPLNGIAFLTLPFLLAAALAVVAAIAWVAGALVRRSR